MKARAFPAREIPGRAMEDWRSLQHSNSHLASPFFCPEYTTAIAAARDDVFVAFLEEGGKVVGCFPFQRNGHDSARPVGWPMCDYEAVIAGPATIWDANELLRDCRLRAWEFDHLLVSQAPFRSFHRVHKISPIVDMSANQEGFFQQSAWFREMARNIRKLEREIGPVRFEPQVLDHEALDRLLVWWARKWTGHDKVGSWHRNAFHTILDTRTPSFAGTLSVLCAGDNFVAMSFGMRSRSVWHYWFPAYNPQFARYSPGTTLLAKMITTATSLGITTLDLGPGEEHYKTRFMNSFVPIASGIVEAGLAPSNARRFRFKIRGEVLQRNWLRPIAKTTAAVARSITQILNM